MCIKIVELIGNSPKSFEDAVADGVKRAGQTIRGISGVDVIGQTAVVEDNKIVEYRVNMKVAFKVE
jgi:flavin-binding protein dodecin